MSQIAFDVTDEQLKEVDDFCDAANKAAGKVENTRQSVALGALLEKISKPKKTKAVEPFGVGADKK